MCTRVLLANARLFDCVGHKLCDSHCVRFEVQSICLVKLFAIRNCPTRSTLKSWAMSRKFLLNSSNSRQRRQASSWQNVSTRTLQRSLTSHGNPTRHGATSLNTKLDSLIGRRFGNSIRQLFTEDRTRHANSVLQIRFPSNDSPDRSSSTILSQSNSIHSKAVPLNGIPLNKIPLKNFSSKAHPYSSKDRYDTISL